MRQIEDTTSDYDREKLQERLAKLAGGVAVIKVGAPTEVEMKEKKARVEDALHSTRAAVEEGVVAGRRRRADSRVAGDRGSEGRQRRPERRHRHCAACDDAPLRQIAANAGDEGSVVLDKVRNLKGNNGYNAATGEYGDMLEMGILDPAKVTRTALQAAASVAGLMITTEAMVADVPEDKEEADHGGGRNGWHGRWHGLLIAPRAAKGRALPARVSEHPLPLAGEGRVREVLARRFTKVPLFIAGLFFAHGDVRTASDVPGTQPASESRAAHCEPRQATKECSGAAGIRRRPIITGCNTPQRVHDFGIE